jgi:thioredoxin-related protein
MKARLTRITIRSMRKVFVLLFLVNVVTPAFSQDAEGSRVKWMKLEEAMVKVKKEPKPIIMDFYTDWCGWCKKMMSSTYADEGLASYINTYFYPVKFDAEGKDTVEFLGKKYGPTSMENKRPHELAVKLLNNNLMYPTTLFMNGYEKEKDAFQMNMIASGYLDAQKISPILIFTLENAYKNASMDDFDKEFKKANADTTLDDKMKEFAWKDPKTSFADSIPKKRKTLVFLWADWCNSCKVMSRTSFTDSLNAEYLKSTYNCISFNVESMDTINFKNKVFTNPRSPQQAFHQFAFALTKGNFAIPSTVLLDEEMNYLDNIPSYLPPVILSQVSHYYGDNIYKTKSWTDYYNELQVKEDKSKKVK